MHDSATRLSRLARDSLAGAPHATMLVEGLGRIEPRDGSTVLCECDGTPRLLCPATSPLTLAGIAGTGALLTVPISPGAGTSGSVIFVGHLVSLGTHGGPQELTSLLELRLGAVVIESDDPGSATVGHQHVALERYLHQQQDPALPGRLGANR